jgi:hypothetical protein
MTVIYSQTLNDDGSLGDDCNYVIVIPASAVSGNDTGLRISYRGPASGQSRLQPAWIGHPDGGYGFLEKHQVLIGGAATRTIAANELVESDIVNFQRDPAKDLLLAFGLRGGDSYRRKVGLPSSFVQHYKFGSGDAEEDTKSGYSAQSGRTSLIESIEAVPYEAPETPPPSEPEGEANSGIRAAALAARLHSAGKFIAGETGKYLYMQLRNPESAGSKLALLWRVTITPTVDTKIEFRSLNTAIGAPLPIKCNHFFGAGSSVMDPRGGLLTDPNLGNHHYWDVLKAGKREVIYPYVALDNREGLGRGVVACLLTDGAGADFNLEWEQI